MLPAEGRRRVDTSGAPERVQSGYAEAIACLAAGAPRATAAMVRRAVQAACLDLGADADRKLYKQIEQLHETGEFSNRLKALADRLRLFGNDGAHPTKDGLEPIGPEQAELAVRFLEHLIEHVYIIDAELESAGGPES